MDAMTEPVIHDPAGGVFDWNGEVTAQGIFMATHVGDYLITYFQPNDPANFGCVQVHFGTDIQFAYTKRAREAGERFAEMAARNPDAYLPITDCWVPVQ